MRIHIEIVPAKSMRYFTCGDWQVRNGDLYIQVAQMGDRRFESLVAIHECVEAVLCVNRGIATETVDAFDMEFEAARSNPTTFEDGEGQSMTGFSFHGRFKEVDAEPGDDQDAPYAKEHFFATSIERLIAAELGVDWAEYSAAVNAL